MGSGEIRIVCTWLPELFPRPTYQDELSYIHEVYNILDDSFRKNTVLYDGQPVSLKKYPLTNNIDYTFWHLTTDGGPPDQNRVIAYDRIERVNWIKAVIEKGPCTDLWIWKTKRKNRQRILLYVHNKRYLVILEKRKNYYLLITAYLIQRNRRHRKLETEYRASL